MNNAADHVEERFAMNGKASVEQVLNSRCSCDFDGDPKRNHWGVFVKDKRPSRRVIEHVLQCCKRTPKFSRGKLSFWFGDNCLFLGFEKTNDPFEARLFHIESGMQHEAVYLACTTLGVGTCIRNLGINGTTYGNKIATARHLILENADSYNEGKFTTETPGPEKSFRKSKNLTLPRRKGDTECLPALKRLTITKDDGAYADETDISQMLWAAKGRTPHYIKSHPWGLTIPTWGGRQNNTSIYLIKEHKLFRYINWTMFRYINLTTKFFPWWIAGNPTHDVKFVRNLNTSFQLDHANVGIMICRNEKANRSLWEAGYILENMLLQAKSLGISYKSKVFSRDEVRKLERNGISEAVAAILL